MFLCILVCVLFYQSALSTNVVPLYDTFTTYNDTVWAYADGTKGTTDGSLTWYLKNHSRVDAVLSDGSIGLSMLMSACPHPSECGGAEMISDHAQSLQSQLYGTYTLKARAPHKVNSSSADDGVYAYFTAGYAQENGIW